MKNVLVIVAHPDDEVLGCGGAIARHCAEGDLVSVVCMADGVSSRFEEKDKTLLHARHEAAHRAASILGIHHITFLAHPDNSMDQVALLSVVRDVEQLVKRYQPETIYTHHFGDLNIDHRLVHEAVITACRPSSAAYVKKLLFFETPSSTEWRAYTPSIAFVPNYFVDISSHLLQKKEALSCYREELHSFPHPRSLEAVEYLARWRGAMVGIIAAEAFELGRLIV